MPSSVRADGPAGVNCGCDTAIMLLVKRVKPIARTDHPSRTYFRRFAEPTACDTGISPRSGSTGRLTAGHDERIGEHRASKPASPQKYGSSRVTVVIPWLSRPHQLWWIATAHRIGRQRLTDGVRSIRPGHADRRQPRTSVHRFAASGLDRDTRGREFGLHAINDAAGSSLPEGVTRGRG